MTTTIADALVSEMAQNFNDALDGVDPIDLNEDKTLKWRGLLNNKFAAASGRRTKKSTDSDTTISNAPPLSPSSSHSVFSSTTTHPIGSSIDGGDKTNNEPTAIDKEPVGGAIVDTTTSYGAAAAHGADKPKRVLRRKAKPIEMQSSVNAEKKTTRASKSMSKDDRDDETAGVVESEAEVPKRKSRAAAKRASDAQEAAGQPHFEPKSLRTRRSDRQVQQNVEHTRDGIEEKAKIEREKKEAKETHITDESTQQHQLHELNSEIPKQELSTNDVTDNESVRVIEQHYETIDVDDVEESEHNGDTKDVERDVMQLVEVKKQRQSTEEEDTKNVNSFVMTVMGDDKLCKTEEVEVEVKDEDQPQITPAEIALTPIASPPVSPPPTDTTPIASSSFTPITTHPEIKIPKKRGRKPGFKKLLNPISSATKKSARISREQDPDPAFDPVNKIANSQSDASNVPTRLSRRIKPTAKILANDELRYGFELQNNARLSLSSEHLDAERSPVKDEQNLTFATISSVPCSKVASPVEANSSDVEERRIPKTKTKLGFMVVIPQRRRAPCPDPVEFLNAIKQDKINLNRSPEDNKKMSQKQRKRLLKLKEKHLNKLGLQRTRLNQPGSSHDSSEADEAEEEFIPNKKVTVGKPNVTLRLRANTITLERPPSFESIRTNQPKRFKSRYPDGQPSAKKRSYTVIKSNHHETSLILSTKHKSNSGINTARSSATPSPTVKPTETDLNNCLCAKPSKYFTKRTPETAHCRAMDEIAGNIIGCCNEVPENDLINLLRPSVRVKYSIFCAAHLVRLQAHHSCAGCGIFCTQGRFIMCQRNHLFHRDCATKFILNNPFRSDAVFVCPTLVLRCPHCGVDAPEKETQISMKCRSNPVFSPYQSRPTKIAKMSIGKHTFASSVGGSRTVQRQFQWELEKLIPAQVMETILRSQEPGHVHSEFKQKDVIHAMRADNVNRMAEIIASGYDINAPLMDFARGTCLHLVASYGSLAMAYLLLSRSPSVDYINRFDRELKSAVMCSVFNAKNDVLRLLVQCGADVTLRGYGGMTALHMAAKANNFAATQIILESYRRTTSAHRFGLLVNAVDDGGWTTIVWAAELGYSDIVTYLVQCGANLSICDAQKNTVLHWAALSDDVATVRPLLSEADLNVQNMNGDTPLHIACRNSNTRMCLMFLAHGACLELQNDQAEKPFDGISDENSVCAKAVKFNQKLRALARFGEHAIVCQDISKGREAYPIKVIKRHQKRSSTSPVNDDDLIDDDDVPHFIYITQSIILQNNIQIDRRISKMRICSCVDNCTSSCCQCSEISVQNWYNSEGRLNGDFNFADPAMIFECSDVCGCNKMQCMNRVVQNGQKVALQVVEYGGNKKWGVTTVGDIARGTYVSEYTGEILTDAEAERRTDDSYFFDLDASEHCIDAHYYGNVSRFFNHSCEPNVVPIRVYYDHQDLRFPKIAFFAARDIAANEEITFDYGEKFWLTKYKSFSCECRSTKCRFPGAITNTQPLQRSTNAKHGETS